MPADLPGTNECFVAKAARILSLSMFYSKRQEMWRSVQCSPFIN